MRRRPGDDPEPTPPSRHHHHPLHTTPPTTTMSVSGPKLGHTLLTVPKCDSIATNTSTTSNSSQSSSEQEYPGLKIENLRSALERGQMNTSLGMNTDIQSFYHKLKEIQRSQPQPPAPAQKAEKKNSFSIDSLAKSSVEQTNTATTTQQLAAAAASFNQQHQELYRKALENLHNARQQQQQPTLVPAHGINQIMGIRPNMFPTAQHSILQQATMARMQAQRQQACSHDHKHGSGCSHNHSHGHVHGPGCNHKHGSVGSARKLSSSIVREAKNQLKGLDPENMYIECPLCHKRIKRLYHFQRHMRIHSGEKSHQCPYCPYKSVRKDNLKSHLKTHEKHAMEARRNAEMLDKKRSSDMEAIRRLQFNAMKMAAGMGPVPPPTAARHHPYMHPGATGTAPHQRQLHHQAHHHHQHQPGAPTSQPTVPPPSETKFDYQLKEEPAVEITEIDSGCESPQEQASPMRQHCQSDTSGIESGHSERHSSKESDSSFTNEDGEDRIIDVTK